MGMLWTECSHRVGSVSSFLSLASCFFLSSLVNMEKSTLSYWTIAPVFEGKSLTISLRRHICESSVEIRVECPPENVQSDVRKACVHVTVNSQNHRVRANHSAGQDVQLWKKGEPESSSLGERNSC